MSSIPPFPVLQRGKLITDGLIGCWRMYEGSGLIAHDISGNGRHGTLVGLPTWKNGREGSCLDFDGNDYVNLQKAIFNTTNTYHPYSAFAWIKTSVGDGILTQYWYQATRWGFRVNAGKLMYWKGGILTQSSANVNSNTWRHVGFVKKADRSLTLYIDGSADGTGTDNIAFENTATLIGAFSSTIALFNGSIDDVRVYNRALSEQEIKTIRANHG